MGGGSLGLRGAVGLAPVLGAVLAVTSCVEAETRFRVDLTGAVRSESVGPRRGGLCIVCTGCVTVFGLAVQTDDCAVGHVAPSSDDELAWRLFLFYSSSLVMLRGSRRGSDGHSRLVFNYVLRRFVSYFGQRFG
ncbi:hypothetical protein EVAR_83971_1 [Eumeta japonica]|uniref:Secreted protein n=1 Tax=Eumeta variegata TaxID=151549 RepID=A0A4C1VNP1_EUMVA|nr:hypothetical protein EVAR_83971_1 [Eumeta japonica]